jgi:hypothetical protein
MAQMGGVPADDLDRDLDHVHPRHPGLAHGLGQREADAEAADQDLRCGGGAAGERRRDHEPLGPAITGVHEEHAVADDLERGARLAQD